ncbi:uncharacterized protein EDB91DRAFT_1088590 [Suillus paluster]|uniref:uncharacterized protein n=1 Tax=Suillus paluster TaxID=48578 RepID=UPI001B88372D|nr:uncharacterized protein EDB91DRAFT_1088590 [Suillus paluster]KAG1721043.1 hypothetical protein EDB91DRAFT_1088590 [Suillus paluster]
MLLCPVKYIWSLSLTKDKIRDRDSDFLVTTYSWPVFMYKDHSFDSANIEKGLFHSTLLLKAFKHLFMSLPFTKEIDSDGNGADVITASQHSNIIGMKTVTPCAIAYTACQESVQKDSYSFPYFSTAWEVFSYKNEFTEGSTQGGFSLTH